MTELYVAIRVVWRLVKESPTFFCIAKWGRRGLNLDSFGTGCRSWGSSSRAVGRAPTLSQLGQTRGLPALLVTPGGEGCLAASPMRHPSLRPGTAVEVAIYRIRCCVLSAGPSWNLLGCLEPDWCLESQKEERTKKKSHPSISNKGWTALIHDSLKNSSKSIDK